jgi:ubiquinone/menaquinone biosynthesis C-methylase UbiE
MGNKGVRAIPSPWWILILGLGVILFGFIAGWPMRVPREPEREGFQDAEAVAAYDRVSHGWTFILERFVVMRALARRPPRGVLVDLGCGPGYLAARISRRYPAVEVIGIDVNPDMLAAARRNWPKPAYPNLSFVFGDAGRLPLAGGRVDTVVTSVSLHHWPDPRAALAEVRRVLETGGSFVLFDIRRDSPRAAYWALAIGQRFFTPPAIRRTNGAVGSFWAAYTVPELTALLREAGWAPDVSRGPAWMLAGVRNDSGDARWDGTPAVSSSRLRSRR